MHIHNEIYYLFENKSLGGLCAVCNRNPAYIIKVRCVCVVAHISDTTQRDLTVG